MAIFLNTNKLNQWIPKVITTSKKELVIIVPYISTSQKIFTSLKEADRNGVETTLIYRENKLSDKEREKLLLLKNINLLHHPNVHCKCYFNGDLLILGSMNMYEYSEKNNREMGVLLHKEGINENGDFDDLGDSDNYLVFEDAVEEIREITNGATLEKLSDKAKANLFTIDILKTPLEIEIERCNVINNYSLNKKFKPFQVHKNIWMPICENYFDKVDVIFDDNRLLIRFNLPAQELQETFYKWKASYSEFEFKGFKYYWNYYETDLLLYKDWQNYDWEKINDPQLYYAELNRGIGSIIKKYRSITGK